MLLLDNEAIEPLLDPREMVDVIENAYRAYAGGEGVSAPRNDLQAPGPGRETYQLGTVAAVAGPYACVRIKSDMTYLREVDGLPRKEKYAVEPGRYCGLVLLFSAENGAPLAILHDGHIQHMRVGADSAIGIRLMARPGSRVLGILGAGGMARSHLRTIAATSPVRQFRVYSPTVGNRERLAEEARALGLDAEAVARPEEVMETADILCSCTNSVEEVVLGRHLRPGTHVTAIGGRLDQEASDRVDRWLRLGLAIAAPEWGGQKIEEECLSFSASGEKSRSGGTRRFASIPLGRRIMLGDLLEDPSLGRTGDAQITFSDRGNVQGLQFAAVAGRVYEKAMQAGLGRPFSSDDFTQTVRN
ncbi:ornithine cyclodeaminase family protein [Faunimonas sp. B44]|uniref:ornithine cyclodeaminase family protein n=1 Tax=Faunimonas sp. B44 TaxID=3461493 RepID=UPI0040449E32